MKYHTGRSVIDSLDRMEAVVGQSDSSTWRPWERSWHGTHDGIADEARSRGLVATQHLDALVVTHPAAEAVVAIEYALRGILGGVAVTRARKKPRHGGRRPGAGRPRSTNATDGTAVWIGPDLRDQLDAIKTERGLRSRAEAIEWLVCVRGVAVDLGLDRSIDLTIGERLATDFVRRANRSETKPDTRRDPP